MLADPIRDEVGSLIDQEVPCLRNRLAAHLVRVWLVAFEQLGRDVEVPSAEQHEGRGGQPSVSPAATKDLEKGRLVVAIEGTDRVSARRLAEVVGIGVQLGGSEGSRWARPSEDVP